MSYHCNRLGLGLVHLVYWTQTNDDTYSKVDTCHHLNESNTIRHWT